MVKTQTLVKIAALGGPFVVVSGLFFTSRIHANFRQQEFYVKTVSLMNGYPPAISILGKPIAVRKIDLGNRRLNYTDGLNARLAIPVSGKNEKGVLHSWSSREKLEDSWQVDKCDLEVKGRQWTFYIHPKARDRHKPTGETDSNSDTSKVKEDNNLDSKETKNTSLTPPSEELEYLNISLKR